MTTMTKFEETVKEFEKKLSEAELKQFKAINGSSEKKVFMANFKSGKAETITAPKKNTKKKAGNKKAAKKKKTTKK